MPAESAITALGWKMLGTLPPFLRDDPEYRAILHCYAKETERADAKLEWLRAQLNPASAEGVGLDWWEDALKLPRSTDTDAARQDRIVARYGALQADPAGRAWVAAVTARVGNGWSYMEHVPGDATTPAAQTVRIFLPFSAISASWANAIVAVREETPSELALEFVSTGGFLLDVSEMDSEGLSV